MMPHGELWGYVAGAVIGAMVLLIALMRTGPSAASFEVAANASSGRSDYR